MRYLLDTHTLLWLATDDPRLGSAAKAAVLDLSNDLYLSLASVWEIAIKRSLGRLEIEVPTERFVRNQCLALATKLLPIELSHVTAVEALEFHHRDPFDRLLVSQAHAEGLALLSRDRVFDTYGVPRIWD